MLNTHLLAHVKKNYNGDTVKYMLHTKIDRRIRDSLDISTRQYVASIIRWLTKSVIIMMIIYDKYKIITPVNYNSITRIRID